MTVTTERNPYAALIVPLTATVDRIPAYCIHPVSGSAYVYVDLARRLPGRQLIGIEAPGFDTDLPAVASIPQLAEEYARLILPRPCRLLGWSMGGVLAFELARLLSDRGSLVDSVILVDTPVPRGTDAPTEQQIAERFLVELLGEAAAEVITMLRVELTAGAEAMEALLRLATEGPLTESTDEELVRRRYSVFRANVLSTARHVPSGKYAGPVIHVRAAESSYEQEDWARFATEIRFQVVPGDHFGILRGTGGAALLDIVRAAWGNDGV